MVTAKWRPDPFCAEGCWPLCLCGLFGDDIAKDIVRAVRDRLVTGRQRHGTWAANDLLDSAEEAWEEFIDGLVYSARGLLKVKEALSHDDR